MNGGSRLTSLDQSVHETVSLLKRVAGAKKQKQESDLPAIIAGATLRIPRGIMLPEAILILDAVAIRFDGDRPHLSVGEIKTYPDRGGYTDPHDLAIARAQAGIYLHALDTVVQALGLDGGGSTTMVVEDCWLNDVVNNPSDDGSAGHGGSRSVASAAATARAAASSLVAG